MGVDRPLLEERRPSMIIAIDWDGTVVMQDLPYADTTTPPTFVPGAVEGLMALKRAGHKLVLYSARANRSLREDPYLDPLVRAGIRIVDEEAWLTDRVLHQARYDAMVAFVSAALSGVFDVIDDGEQGKPNVDLFIDDRMALALGVNWSMIASVYGDPDSGIEVL
jgi:hypothetical protein